MPDTSGSSKLTPKQTAELEARFGFRYVGVQDDLRLIRTPDGKPVLAPNGEQIAATRAMRRAFKLRVRSSRGVMAPSLKTRRR